MTETLDDIFSGKTAEVEEAEVVEPKATETETEDTTGEKPAADSAEQKDSSTPEPESTKEAEESWTKTAVLDERRKRQELERKIQDLEAKLNPPPEPKKAPDVFEDPEGYTKHLRSEVSTMILTERINLSRAMMEAQFKDYPEKEKVFLELAKSDPSMIEKLRSHPIPAKFAYEQAAKHLQYQEMQNVDAYKAKLKEEVRQELLRETKEKDEAEAKKIQAIEPSLAKMRSTKENPHAEQSLQEIFGR